MKRPQPTPANTVNKMLGKYDGLELKPFTNRPGSMDAFKLPSVIGQKLVYRKDAGEIK